MSDGPHRSLPLRRHWKILAERAAKDAYSRADVLEALEHCLAKDLQRDVPVEFVREVLGDAMQGSLLTEDRVNQLEAARNSCWGSALANGLIDAAITQVIEGNTGEAALTAATESAYRTHAQSQARAMEEHYQREAGSRSASFLGGRLDDALGACDFAEQARNVSTANPRVPRNLPSRSGLDDGPEIPTWRVGP